MVSQSERRALQVPIYHLAEPADWAARTDVYETASLEGEGFIHCSTADQLDWVTREFYGNRTDVIVLEIDPGPLGEALVYEDLYGHGQRFPHVYGPIPVSAVVDSRPLTPTRNG